MTDEQAVDVRELAMILRVSTDTVYSMARAGEIPAFRVGRVWRFWPSQVRQHLSRPDTPRDPWAQPPMSAVAHRGWETRRRLRSARNDETPPSRCG